MNWWIVALGLSCAVMLAGLVFIRKRWGTEGEASLEHKLVKVTGSPAFVIFVIGALGAAYSISELAATDADRRDPRVVLGEVREVRGIDRFSEPAGANDRDRMLAFARWMLQFFEDAEIVIDKGSNDGLRRGQWVTTLEDRVTARQVRLSELGAYNSDGTAMLRVVTVHPDEGVAQLLEFGIDAYAELLEKSGDPSPVVSGQQVLGLPQDETDASSKVERSLRAARDERDRTARRIYYRQAVEDAERFLLDHPDSFLVPDVMFDLGDAQKGLGRRAAAKETFERYVERHPFHASVDGARERIEELEAPRRAKD